MQFARLAVVAMFKELGFDTADSWSAERCVTKMKKLPGILPTDAEADTEESQKLLKKIVKAVEKGEDIEITGDKPAAAKEEKEGKKEKSSKKKAAAKEEEDDDDDEAEDPSDTEDEDEDETDDDEEGDSDDDDDDDEDEKVKVKKDKKKGKAPPKKAGGEGGPGVIGSIVEFLQAADEDKPITKQGMCDKLAKRFPDRDPKSMMRTINVQVPNRIKVDKKLTVNKNDKGYWIDTDGDSAKKSEKKKDKKKKASKKDDE